MTTEHRYHIPQRPFSPIDALNRRSACLGSVAYAQGASSADYNGHHVTVAWNSYRGFYIASYMWSGPRVIASGSAEECIAAAVREYDKGALGASVSVRLREEDVEIASLFPQLIAGDEGQRHWRTWQHEVAEEAARDASRPDSCVMLFDWQLMQVSENRREYEAALKAKHGRIWA